MRTIRLRIAWVVTRDRIDRISYNLLRRVIVRLLGAIVVMLTRVVLLVIVGCVWVMRMVTFIVIFWVTLARLDVFLALIRAFLILLFRVFVLRDWLPLFFVLLRFLFDFDLLLRCFYVKLIGSFKSHCRYLLFLLLLLIRVILYILPLIRLAGLILQ